MLVALDLGFKTQQLYGDKRKNIYIFWKYFGDKIRFWRF